MATATADELLTRLAALDTDLPADPTTVGYAELDQMLNLNAVAIGLGLDDVEYQPEEFPGLLYAPDEYDETVTALFGHGVLFVASSGSVDPDALVDHVVKQIRELGLIDEDTAGAFDRATSGIPVPDEYDQESEDETPTCSACGHELSGDENFCPECGEEVEVDCPECGVELSGAENYCPNCGTAVSGA